MLDNKKGMTFMMIINGHARKCVGPIMIPFSKETYANKVGMSNANPSMANIVVGCWVLCAIAEAIVRPIPMAELPINTAMKSMDREVG